MKNLMILLTLIFSLFLIITSCSDEIIDNSSNDCEKQFNLVNDAFIRCQPTEDVAKAFIAYKEGIGCDIYTQKISDNSQKCEDNLSSLLCNDVNKIKTVDDIDSSLGCFDFLKKTKKDACIENYKRYCSSSFYECGEGALSGICDDAKNIYGSSESREIDFDESKLDTFCKTAVNANQEVEISDFFNVTCPRYRDDLDCATVPEIDFRNDDWKNFCGDE
jgi:hypothetical protein